MRPESLDRDMIDERAREALNMADAKDIVIFLDSGGSSTSALER